MNQASAINLKLNELENGPTKNINISGASLDHILYLFHHWIQDKNSHIQNKNNLFVLESNESAELLYDKLKFARSFQTVHYLPGMEASPYLGHLSSYSSLIEKYKTIGSLKQEKNQIIITTRDALLYKYPKREFFAEHNLTISVSDIIAPLDLARSLVSIGYSSSSTVEEPGTFSSKGEIFDIYPINSRPIRIIYFDDMIESIFQIEEGSQRTQKDINHETVKINLSPLIYAQHKKFQGNLRENLPSPGPQFKNKFEHRKQILNSLDNNILFDGIDRYIPLLHKENSSLLDYIDKDRLNLFFINENDAIDPYEFRNELEEQFEEISASPDEDWLLPSPEQLYYKKDIILNSPPKMISFSQINLSSFVEENINTMFLKYESLTPYINKSTAAKNNVTEHSNKIYNYINQEFEHSGEIEFCYQSENSKKEFDYNLSLQKNYHKISSRISYLNLPLEKGFIDPGNKTLTLSEADLFSYKKSRSTKKVKKNIDLFAEQISSLDTGDFVIHREHGIGIYQGLTSMPVASGEADFVIIEYENSDKIYLPVYRLNLVQKYANKNESAKVANLRSNKFDQAKSKAKNAAKKLAFDLLRLQAERELNKSFAFSPPDHNFKEFELAFPFRETKDQREAIDNVIEDMVAEKSMDRLVCGDVGFGKTEIAMRAAFKAVLDGKQVAILVPTTILALQHYNSFIKRFKNFAVNIEFLSRFKTAKESSEIIEANSNGKVDILIGTHKLLSGKIKFHDLGLLIIDEEQRFGVSHKEKLKLLRVSVDVLTLTATPIPRTMQLAFLGLKDLSLIQTAPPKRQSVKTYIIKEDQRTIASAIEKELKRGGQVFFVHNRVQNIEEFAHNIKELVPSADVIVAHGQLPEKELEKRISQFYNGKFNVLVSTTIIESGIDIPTANTMIINRADTFGLSQLHQLRGRIGRSDRKAYAYFLVPQTKSLTPIASRRLQALQTYAEMGSGFSIASSDLEIRGAGDILGGEQSGYIGSIGLELYMELLQDAIAEIKGEHQAIESNLEINIPEASYIPKDYISDNAQRLKYYKKISNTRFVENLDQLHDEMQDIFGIIPQELNNLFHIIRCRIILKNTGLRTLNVTKSQVHLKFDSTILDKNTQLRDKIVDTFMARPKVYKLTPDYNVVYTPNKPLDQELLLQFCQDVAQQVSP